MKSKQTLLKEIKDLEVAITGEETATELNTMLKKAKVSKKTAPKEPAAPAAAPIVSVPKGKAKTSVHVKTSNGTRVFSKSEHGADFNDTAAEFAQTNAHAVIAVTHDEPTAKTDGDKA